MIGYLLIGIAFAVAYLVIEVKHIKAFEDDTWTAACLAVFLVVAWPIAAPLFILIGVIVWIASYLERSY